jgi:hypothetical protein
MSSRTKSKKKQTSGKRRAVKTSASPSLDPLRTGMPALDSITGVEVFGKGKKVFQVIHTSEVDAYEKPRKKPARKKT